MLKTIILMIKNTFKDLDKKAIHIMKQGLEFCFILCILSISLLAINEFIFTYPNLYNIGLLIFQISTIFAIEFVICALAMDTIKKQLQR